jgi:tryptophanyl-tRNA synthetase
LGNYFGAMRPCIELQDEGQAILFIADFHALTQAPTADQLRQRVIDVAVDWLACGIDPEKTIFFRQSDVPEVTELTWILMNATPMGLLERCTSYKDKIGQGLKPNHGLFSYPVLMAADILLYRSHVVPVGRDQKQHLEVTRDIAQRFNNQYGDVLVLPEARIRDEVAIVPGIDGRKMSKSYDNGIPLFGDEKPTRKRIMKVVTDSTPMEEAKTPETCNVFSLHKLLASTEESEALRQRYLEPGMGYGHAKQALFEVYWEYFRPMREKRADLMNNLDHVSAVLAGGAERARELANVTMDDVRRAVGLR